MERGATGRLKPSSPLSKKEVRSLGVMIKEKPVINRSVREKRYAPQD